MLELPEAITIAAQLKQTVVGKTVESACAAHTPHGFAFYSPDTAAYAALLAGRKITDCASFGGQPELWLDELRLCFNDGVNLRYLANAEKLPPKHQLHLIFTDGTALYCTVQMYGGMVLFRDGENDNMYYNVAKEKPSPLSDVFDEAYFSTLRADCDGKTSAKAFLATKQRVPGLGNGVLQDILWNAGVHPKRKLADIDDAGLSRLFHSVKDTLAEMTALGGRDTEKDLFAVAGGYRTMLSKNNAGMPCPRCGDMITRSAYLGGNVYTCGCTR